MIDLKKPRAGVIALAMTAAVAVPAIAFAQSGHAPGATHTPTTSAATFGANAFGGLLSVANDGHRGTGAHLEALATELGVTTDALQAALESVKSSLDRPQPGDDPAAYRAAFAGTLAQALGIDEATVTAALDSYGFPGGRPGRGHDGARLDDVATTLGVSVEDLHAAVEQAVESIDRPAPDGDFDAYRTAVVNSVAGTLGLDAATVDAAFAAGAFSGHGPRHGGKHLDDVATTLGVTTDALDAAIEQAKTTVDRPEPGGDRDAYRTAVVNAIASTLGLDPAAVEAAFGDRVPLGDRGPRDRGARLDDLATTLGVTTDALEAALEQAKTTIDRPGPDGDVEAYRTAIINSVASSLGLDPAAVEAAIGDGLPFGGHGGPGGHGRRGGGFRGGDGQNGGAGSGTGVSGGSSVSSLSGGTWGGPATA